MNIGIRLREERKQKKLTQEQLATFSETTKKSIITYEKEKAAIPSSFLEKIAPLGFDVQYIITGVRSDSALLPHDEQLLLSLYRQATDDIKKATLAVAATGNIASKDITVSHNIIKDFTIN